MFANGLALYMQQELANGLVQKFALKPEAACYMAAKTVTKMGLGDG